MRCSGWSSLAIGDSALLFAGPAAAHVIASPPTYRARAPSRSRSRRRTSASMPMIRVRGSGTAQGCKIVHRASGRGLDRSGSCGHVVGRIARLGEQLRTFRGDLKANAKPGLIVRTEQRYADHGVVEWPVVLTITKPPEPVGKKPGARGRRRPHRRARGGRDSDAAWRRRPPPRNGHDHDESPLPEDVAVSERASARGSSDSSIGPRPSRTSE